MTINGIDTAKGLARYNGNEAVYVKILRAFAESLRAALGPVRAVNASSLPDYKISIHGAKGACYDIFADALGRMAEALEKAAAAGDFAFISENNPAFLYGAEEMLRGIDNFIAVCNKANPKPKKDKPCVQLLLALRTACEEYSLKRADTAMDELEKYEYDTENDLIEWLRQNLDAMNFQEIGDRLSGIPQEGGLV
jgi:hypothetical protein